MFSYCNYILLICSIISGIASQRSFQPQKSNDQLWENVTNEIHRYFHSKSVTIQQKWYRIINESKLTEKVNPKCIEVLDYIIHNPIEQEWSAKLIDSMSMFPPGLLSGTTTELGDFDQCQSVQASYHKTNFVGKYCLATVNLPRQKLFDSLDIDQSKLQYKWMKKVIEKWHNNDNYYSLASAVCFPSLCHETEIREIFLAYYPILESLEFNVTYCQSKEESRQFDSRIWIALIIMIIPWLLIIPGTLYELFVGISDSPSFLEKIFISFSLLSNSRILTQIVDVRTMGVCQFQFIHGIRALAAIFILIAHSSGMVPMVHGMRVSVIARYATDIIEYGRMIIAQPFYSGALIVFTFFVISGMFLTYWTASPKRLKLNFVQYILLRWFRYTPPLIGMLCLTICLELVGSGPLFHHDLLWPNLHVCYNEWWKHLLYFNNYNNMNETCGIQTWYIATEMQLHIAAFIFLVAYTRSPRLAFWIAVLFICLGMTIIISTVGFGLISLPLVQVIAYTQFFPPNDAVKFLFFSPAMNMIPYFIGVIIGQMLLEKKIVHFSKFTTIILWILAASILITLPFASYLKVNDLNVIPGDKSLSNAILFSISIVLWSMANGWLLYQCAINSKNILNQFLSAKIFQPISRLSFCLYLVHVMTIWFDGFQTRTTISFGGMNEIFKATSLTIIESVFFAYILYVTFEAPSVNLIKIFMDRQIKSMELKNQSLPKNNHSEIVNDENNNKADVACEQIEKKQQ